MCTKPVKFMIGRVKTGRGSVQDKQGKNWFRTVRVSGQEKCRSEQSQAGLGKNRAIKHRGSAGPGQGR